MDIYLQRGQATPTAEGEPLGEGCLRGCALQLLPLIFLALDHSLPTWNLGKEAIHFIVPTGTLLRVNGDTINSYPGTARIKWLFQAKQDVSPLQCHSTFGAWENPVRALFWNSHGMTWEREACLYHPACPSRRRCQKWS